MHARRVASLVVCAVCAAACSRLLGLDDFGYGSFGDAGGPGSPDASGGDGNGEPPQLDASDDVTYTDLQDPSRWSTFDVRQNFNSSAGTFFGGVFDGRFLYLAPLSGGRVVRYDTQASFTDPTAWSLFDVGALMPDGAPPPAFEGGAFDGKYVYFIPYNQGAALVVRHDTTDPTTFGDSTTWEAYDVAPLSPGAGGSYAFGGAVFDGRYLVLPPSSNDGVFLRFDTLAAFGDPTSWSVYSTPSFSGRSHLFSGGIFDGTQTYFAPQNAGVVERHVADASFDAGWSELPVTGSYSGAILDPAHITFVPNGGTAAQLDLSVPWTAGNAWSTFSMASLDAGLDARPINDIGYLGGTFDGRYAYFVPAFFQGVGFGNVVARVDTLTPFTDAGSWTTFDMTRLDAGPRSCAGAVFDGHYVYFVPLQDATVVRFEARTTSAPPPPGNHFSFY